jgi:putative transposase
MISVLQAAEAGRKPEELVREHGMAVETPYAWKAKFGGMSVNDAQRLRTMEGQIWQLKSLIADQALDNQMLRSLIENKS